MDFSLFESGEFCATFCGLLWAVAVILFKKSGEQVPPVALNLFKGAVGLVLFPLTMLLAGLPFFPAGAGASDWIILLISGAIGIGMADSMFFAALNRLGAGRMAIVDCLYSPFVILCSFVYLREPVTAWLFAAIALMTGAILIGTWNPERASGTDGRRTLRVGVFFGVLSQLLMAIGIVIVKPVLDVSEPWWATTVRLAGGMAFLTIHGMFPSQRRAVFSALRPSRQWRLTVPAAVIGAYLALIFWILGMKYTYTTIASVLNQLSIIFILVLATIFLREPLTLRKGFAVGIGVLAGVLAAV